MNTKIIRAHERPKINKIWLTIDTCFNYGFIENDENKDTLIQNSSVSLIEICIKPNMGFVPHKHKNKDFIIIPIEGRLIQRNDNGDLIHVKTRNVHYMQTGTGITHFEYNTSMTDDLVCLVFQINPTHLNTNPAYKTIMPSSKLNTINKVQSNTNQENLQSPIKDVLVKYGTFNKKKFVNYKLTNVKNGVLVYLLKGIVFINDKKLTARDTILVWNTKSFIITTDDESDFIIFEFPYLQLKQAGM